MKRVVSLATMAFLTASPAIAGETFVRNDTVHRTNRTETSLEVDTVTKSNRTEHYNTYSEKIFFEGNVVRQTNQAQSDSAQNNDFQHKFASDNSVLKLSNVSLKDDSYADVYNINGSNGLTIHRSGSSLDGTFIEDITTKVNGTVYSVTNESFRSHETTAGVR